MTNIEWTDATWNPVTGCSKVSPGCAHCYAETVTKRYAGTPGWPATFLPWLPENAAENVVLHPDRLDAPLRWCKPRRVFVNSMSDLFHELVPDEFIDRVFAVMALTPWHTYQVLTKRPERMLAYCAALTFERLIDCANKNAEGGEHDVGAYNLGSIVHKTFKARMRDGERDPWAMPKPPLPNVWLGVSVENQYWADKRIPLLLQTPATVRFISAEPLLGPIDLEYPIPTKPNPQSGIYPPWAIQQLNWVIVGGESGPGHRPFDLRWARDIRDQCASAGVAFFCKQMGGARPGTKLDDLPEDLRIREFPR